MSLIFNNNEDDIFIIKYEDDERSSFYSVECEIDGYKRLNSDAPIIDLVCKLRVGEKDKINGECFELLFKSANFDTKYSKDDDNFYTEIDVLKDKLIKKLKQYNPLGFLHTTSVVNLYDIYDDGYLYSRKMIDAKKINFDDIANHNVLDRTNDFFYNCVRFYLRKNTPAGYRFPGKTCILVCNYDIINTNDDMYITEKIATSEPYNNSLNNVMNIKYLLNYFHYSYVYNETYSSIKGIQDYKSAEFLCKNSVSIEYIDKIIFENNDDKEWFLKEFPRWNIEVIVDCEYFKKSFRGDLYD